MALWAADRTSTQSATGGVAAVMAALIGVSAVATSPYTWFSTVGFVGAIVLGAVSYGVLRGRVEMDDNTIRVTGLRVKIISRADVQAVTELDDTLAGTGFLAPALVLRSKESVRLTPLRHRAHGTGSGGTCSWLNQISTFLDVPVQSRAA